jgi:hypothetical protein
VEAGEYSERAYFVLGDMFLLNVSWLSTDYTALYPRRQCSSQPPVWAPQILLTCISFDAKWHLQLAGTAQAIHLQTTYVSRTRSKRTAEFV